MHMYPEAEHMRDMDRDYGKMYYTEPMNEVAMTGQREITQKLKKCIRLIRQKIRNTR